MREMSEKKNVVIRWTIDLPMKFPKDWDREHIEFHLNESSWSCDNLVFELHKYIKKNGSIDSICVGKVKKEAV